MDGYLFVGFGGRELMLVAAIALGLAGLSRFRHLERDRRTWEGPYGPRGRGSRAYLDGLFGPSGDSLRDPAAPKSRR